MTEEDHDVAVTTPEQFKALGHPMRHRLLFALGRGEATISQLAATLCSNKGNISHHLKVLAAAGLVQAAGTRTVRGGTEQYYRRAFASLTYDDATTTEAALRALAAEIATAEPTPFVILRGLRLSPEHAQQLTATLRDLAEQAKTGATTRATACCSACTSLHRRPQATSRLWTPLAFQPGRQGMARLPRGSYGRPSGRRCRERARRTGRAGRGVFAPWNGLTTVHEKIPPSVSHRCHAFLVRGPGSAPASLR